MANRFTNSEGPSAQPEQLLLMSQTSPISEDCREVRILLDAYLDSELGADTATWVLRHLSACPQCEALRVARHQAKAALKNSVLSVEPDPGFEYALRRRLRQEAKPNRYKGLAQLALAAALLVGVFPVWKLVNPAPRPPVDSARAAQDAHIDSLYRLVSASTRPGLGDHLHCAHYRKFGPTLPSFEEMVEKLGSDYQDLLMIAKRAVPTGFQVVMGHRCKYRDRPFIHVALRRDDELLSVIIADRLPEESFELDGLAPVLHEDSVALYQQGAEQFQSVAFETSHHLAYVISNLDAASNLQIAAALAPELSALLKARES